MKRLDIEIDPGLDEALARHADAMGISKAEVVRICIKKEFQLPPPTENDPPGSPKS